MGDFSRDTFDKLKHYVSVRLQQGVPIVDADWNEKDDIRRYELQTFIKRFIGNGVPKGNDGFHILPALPGTADDFIINAGINGEPGCCLVNGWEVVIWQNLNYTGQPVYDKTKALARDVDPLEPLAPPPTAGKRIDLVYLDVWEWEVNSLEDKNLVNPDIGIETCVRIKLEWVVRVAQGSAVSPDPTNPPAPPAPPDPPGLPDPPEGHVYYPLAEITRSAGDKGIDENHIKDLRRKGLAVLSNPVTIAETLTVKDGKVGINTTTPKIHLAIGDEDTGFHQQGEDELAVLTDNEERMRFDKTGNVIIDTTTPGTKLEVNGNAFIHGNNAPVGNEPPKIHLAIGDEDTGFKQMGEDELAVLTKNEERMRIDKNGNVCIGTDTAGATLDVKGNFKTRGKAVIDGNLGIGTTDPKIHLAIGDDDTGFKLEDEDEFAIVTNNKECVRIDKDGNVGIGTPKPGIPLAIGDDDTGFKSPAENELSILTKDKERIRIDKDGNVGIGTEKPGAMLHVNGNAVIHEGKVGIGTTDPKIPLAIGDDDTGLKQLGEDELAILTKNEERICIDKDGNVGVGTCAPEKTLHVKGSFKVDGDVDFGGGKMGYGEGGVGFQGKDGGFAIMTNDEERIYVDKNGNVGIGTTQPGAKLDVNGNLKVDGEVGYLVPKGAIIMWSGDADKIPQGWALCDGSNGTPNLTGKFIIGAAASGFPPRGSQGGSESISIAPENMPAHTHGIKDPGHAHGLNKSIPIRDSSTDEDDCSLPIYARNDPKVYLGTTNNKTNITINPTGNSKPLKHYPPYYALCFIMKK